MKIMIIAVLAAMVAMVLQGCMALAYQDIQRRHESAALRGVVLAGARGPAVGAGVDLAALLDPATSWSATDFVEQLAGVAADIGTGFAAYKIYQNGGSSSENTALPTSITTGNQSPVQITVGNGAPSQHNPNIISTSSTGMKR